jgi:hypothetical protein
MEQRFYLIPPRSDGGTQHFNDGAQKSFAEVIQRVFASPRARPQFGSPSVDNVGRLRFEPAGQLGAIV